MTRIHNILTIIQNSDKVNDLAIRASCNDLFEIIFDLIN